MNDKRFRVKFKHRWSGPAVVGGDKKQYSPGDIEDVDTDTFTALVFRYEIAEAMSVEEIEAQAIEKEKPKKPTGQRASRKKQATAKKDKMVRSAANKGE